MTESAQSVGGIMRQAAREAARQAGRTSEQMERLRERLQALNETSRLHMDGLRIPEPVREVYDWAEAAPEGVRVAYTVRMDPARPFRRVEYDPVSGNFTYSEEGEAGER